MINSPTFSPWFDAKNSELLHQWWSIDGLPASKIVGRFKELGVVVTKNSVIGRIHRAGLKPPEWKPKAQREAAKQREGTKNRERTKKSIIQYVVIDGKRYHPKHKEITMTNEEPRGDKSVLLKDSRDGQCKAIIGYKDGKAALAVYCGQDTVPSIRYGRVVMTSWCAHHLMKYTTEAKR